MATPYDPLVKLKQQVVDARKRRDRRMRRRIIIVGVGALGGIIYDVWPPRPTEMPESLYAVVQETLYAQRTLTLRSSPDSNASAVRTVKPFERVIVAQLKDSPWVRVFETNRPASYASRTRATLLPVPPVLPPPLDTTAVCGDSTPSFSASASGSCNGHHGVLCWIDYPPPVPSKLSKPLCKYAL